MRVRWGPPKIVTAPCFFASAAASHTGSLAGTDEVYDAIMAQAGVLRVDTVQELFDLAMAFGSQPMPQSNRVAIVTNAGGPGIMATDACVRQGLSLATFTDETRARMATSLPAAASTRNPVDLIGDARHDRYRVGRHVDPELAKPLDKLMARMREVDAEHFAHQITALERVKATLASKVKLAPTDH